MAEQEYQALITILSRAPMTPAEALWLNGFLARLRPQPKQPDSRASNANHLD